MPAPDIEKMIRKNLEDLKKLYLRTLPKKVGVVVTNSIKENFRKSSFYGGDRWSEPLRVKLGFRGVTGQYGPLLSHSNKLMENNRHEVLPGRVIIRNNKVYAATHNDGEDITVTEKMRGFFWGKHRDYKTLYGKESPEAEFWKRMALKKPGSKISIPRRHFLGPGPEVDAMVMKIINTELQEFINTQINGTST